MKTSLLTAVLLCALAVVGSASVRPTITNARITTSFPAISVMVSYDVSDPDDSEVTVDLQVSTDGGYTFRSISELAVGDVGKVSVGTDKQITIESATLFTKDPARVRLVVRDEHEVDIHQLLATIEEGAVRSIVAELSIPRNTLVDAGNHTNIRNRIRSAFDQAGLSIHNHEYPYQGTTGVNIVGRKAGVGSTGTTFVLDAHYDAVPGTSGADDNASSVTALLIAADLLSQLEVDNNVSIIAFDHEEDGLIGSSAYVNTGIAAGDTIAAVINLEMIGYASEKVNSQQLPFGFGFLFPEQQAEIEANGNRGNFIANIGNTNSAELGVVFDQFAQSYVPDLKVVSLNVPGDGSIAPDFRRSDHATFWDENIPALLITDGGNFRNPNYHLPTDVVDSLNIPFMTKVIKASIAAILELGGAVNGHSVELEVPTSVQYHDHENDDCSLRAVPVPAAEFITVSFQGCSRSLVLRLFSIDGVKVFEKIVADPESAQVTIPVSALASNRYMLVASSGEQSYSVDVLITR
ncbi:MAG: M28 family peptidase [Ignavibacteria bacterium]|nr:M28 family peptidase [Ignavibacteria bacterium]MBK7412682.1 M28 family peptidase [Ignavibacteria bacterium]MBK7578343.1 M28 family peptidase [Ignavibacteria bacterium]